MTPGPIPPSTGALRPGVWRRLFLCEGPLVVLVRTPALLELIRRQVGAERRPREAAGRRAAVCMVEILESDDARRRAELLRAARDAVEPGPRACIWALIASGAPLLWRRLLDSAHELDLQEDRLHPFAPATVAFRLGIERSRHATLGLRGTAQEDSSLPKVQTTAHFRVTPRQFYDLITDFEALPGSITGVESVQVLDDTPDAWVVEHSIRVIKRLSYTLAFSGRPGVSLEWRQVEGPFKHNSGRWLLESDGDAGTKAHYEMDLELGILVRKAIA